MQVRDWPWWRLLVRVTPLLNVHRTEEQLKNATDELQALKAKMEKLDGDRNALKAENSKLESKVSLIYTLIKNRLGTEMESTNAQLQKNNPFRNFSSLQQD